MSTKLLSKEQKSHIPPFLYPHKFILSPTLNIFLMSQISKLLTFFLNINLNNVTI